MTAPSFAERLSSRQKEANSLVCIGLDPDPELLPHHLTNEYDPAEAVIKFNQAIIAATVHVAAAYKLNLAFFEALGAESWSVLQATLDAIPEDVPVIADGKRGDIGNSARFYARMCFELLNFDACTVSGYMGKDSVAPFLDHPGRGVFLLARTSNPGGADFQEIRYKDRYNDEDREIPLYEHVVIKALEWKKLDDDGAKGSLGFVAGASDIEALHRIRALAPDSPLLIPGVGAQGGSSSDVLKAIREGSGPVLVNSSRAILYASAGHDFDRAARQAAETLRTSLASALS